MTSTEAREIVIADAARLLVSRFGMSEELAKTEAARQLDALIGREPDEED